MFIHIGNKKIISEKNLLGIFNIETLEKSEINKKFGLEYDEYKSVIFLDNEIIKSKISPFTIIKRETDSLKDIFWSRKND